MWKPASQPRQSELEHISFPKVLRQSTSNRKNQFSISLEGWESPSSVNYNSFSTRPTWAQARKCSTAPIRENCFSVKTDEGNTCKENSATSWKWQLTAGSTYKTRIQQYKQTCSLSGRHRVHESHSITQSGIGSWTLIRGYRAEVPCEVSKKFAPGSRAKL